LCQTGILQAGSDRNKQHQGTGKHHKCYAKELPGMHRDPSRTAIRRFCRACNLTAEHAPWARLRPRRFAIVLSGNGFPLYYFFNNQTITSIFDKQS